MNESQDNWIIWQLVDSTFPSGAFVHSGGLEAAVQQGEIRDVPELVSFIQSALWQTVCGLIPFVGAAYDEADSLRELDDRCDAFLSGHVPNRASRAQGRAFLNSAVRIFGAWTPPPELACYHLAPIFGATVQKLALRRCLGVEVFLFQCLRGLLSAAVRLGLIGPIESQRLQRSLSVEARELLWQDSARTVDDVANPSPLLEIWQGGHDRLYSRLFQT